MNYSLLIVITIVYTVVSTISLAFIFANLEGRSLDFRDISRGSDLFRGFLVTLLSIASLVIFIWGG